jgi:hypothetical protein
MHSQANESTGLHVEAFTGLFTADAEITLIPIVRLTTSLKPKMVNALEWSQSPSSSGNMQNESLSILLAIAGRGLSTLPALCGGVFLLRH